MIYEEAAIAHIKKKVFVAFCLVLDGSGSTVQ